MTPVLLLDGSSLVYRAFFALPTDMATASGQVTNAVFGFTSMLINLLRDRHPEEIAVVFDRPEPTFRHHKVPDYKAGRAETPDVLRQQLGLVREVVQVLRIPLVEASGFEADDVIATLATMQRDLGREVVIVTGDRDAYQLVEDPLVKVLYNRRGVSDYVLYDEAGILARTGVTPAKYPEYAALRGDPSDNLPGVPGIGEKTAARLINEYGSLEGIYSQIASLSPKLRDSLVAHERQVRANAEVIPLVRDVPIDLGPQGLRMGTSDAAEVDRLFGFLEMTSLRSRLAEVLGDGAGAKAEEGVEVDIRTLATAREAVEAIGGLKSAGRVAVEPAWEGQPGRSAISGLALVSVLGEAGQPRDRRTAVNWLPGEILVHPEVKEALGGLFGPAGPALDAHRAKELMRALLGLGVDIRSLDVDTALAAYLLDPAGSSYALADIARRYAGLAIGPASEVAGGAGQEPQGRLELPDASETPAAGAARRAAVLVRLAPALVKELADHGLSRLYGEIERPLARVLARMEVRGVRVEREILSGLISKLTEEAERLKGEIQDLAGTQFSVNSTPQLRSVLYDRLGLAPQKRTKTGYSTDAATLERLRGAHPIIEALLRYREVEKLRSTYGETLLAEVGPDGRIHATFNQTVARTGRLSSDQPNLHNIPVRTEEGRALRRAFVPAEGCELLVADYNQIELRVIAHLAEDPGLIEAFESGTDIHRATAARIFGVDPGAVTTAQRARAKMVSYGLAYGMEPYGLAQRLAIPVEEARGILDAYFVAFPRVRSYMEQTVATARDKGYTETLFGRRRQIPELSSSNRSTRLAGERQAMNAGIQGLAADIFKVALVRLDRALEDAGMQSRIILQVHDEVLLEVPPPEHDRAAEMTLAEMRGAAELRVPLEVNLSWGASWADAKP